MFGCHVILRTYSDVLMIVMVPGNDANWILPMTKTDMHLRLYCIFVLYGINTLIYDVPPKLRVLSSVIIGVRDGKVVMLV